LLPPSGEDWLTEDEWEEWAAARCAEEEPPDPEEAVDPDDPSLPAEMDIDVLMAEAEQASAEQARAAEAAARAGTAGAMAAAAAGLGRRGPGQPGSAQRFPGTYTGPACWRSLEIPQSCSLNFPTLGDTPPWSFGPGRLPPMLPVVTVR